MAWPIELISVKGERVVYGEEEAQAALAGYAFGKLSLSWEPPRGIGPESDLGTPPKGTERYRWGYWSFDCVPASPSRISVEDIAATAALDTRIGGVAVLSLYAIRHDLDQALAKIPVPTTFWQLQPVDLDKRPPTPDSVPWWVWRAWALLMGLQGIDRAITHKLLHHKRPWLFPMLDSVTTDHLGGFRAWATIWKDLRLQEQEFISLEDWFTMCASAHNGASLTRLRIHDILLWGDLSGNRPMMESLGRQFFSQL